MGYAASPQPDITPDAAFVTRLGGTASVKYQSNIYRENEASTNDIIGILAPAISLRSQLDKHSLQGTLQLESASYAENSNNNYLDADFRLKGLYDIASDENITIFTRMRYDHVGVGGFAENANNALLSRTRNPVTYKYAELGSNYHLGLHDNFYSEVGILGSLFDFDNNRLNDGTVITENDRDRYEVLGHVTIGYHATPDWKHFVTLEADTRAYDNQINRTAQIERDSTGLNAFLGTMHGSKKDTLWIDGRVGVIQQDYSNPLRPDISTLGFNLSSAYNMNDNTSLRFIADREVLENGFFAASGHVQTRARLLAKHHVNNAIDIDISGRFIRNDFHINNSLGAQDRTDDYYSAIIGSDYHIAKPLYVRAEYGYTDRHSNVSAANYQDNHVMLTLGVTY